jgi:hypothetical protein
VARPWNPASGDTRCTSIFKPGKVLEKRNTKRRFFRKVCFHLSLITLRNNLVLAFVFSATFPGLEMLVHLVSPDAGFQGTATLNKSLLFFNLSILYLLFQQPTVSRSASYYLAAGHWFLSLYNDDGDAHEISFVARVSSELTRNCPKGCSGRGECVLGKCQCNTGFDGPDCAQSKWSELVGFFPEFGDKIKSSTIFGNSLLTI